MRKIPVRQKSFNKFIYNLEIGYVLELLTYFNIELIPKPTYFQKSVEFQNYFL